jgi:hypothetical protein
MGWIIERTAEPEQAEAEAEACGYDPGGWEASIWLLNAMYENPSIPDGLTHDDAETARRSTARRDRRWWRRRRRGRSVDELLSESTATGGALGRSRWPGPGWRRLRWTELGERLEVDPLAAGAPSARSFPFRSWPLRIEPPAEGSLDREQFEGLVGHLVEQSPAGPDEPCFAFYGLLASDDMREPRLLEGRLGELVELYDDARFPGSPSNIWPQDRSWLVYTDWDLRGTKISGDPALMTALAADALLETVPLPS